MGAGGTGGMVGKAVMVGCTRGGDSLILEMIWKSAISAEAAFSSDCDLLKLADLDGHKPV